MILEQPAGPPVRCLAAALLCSVMLAAAAQATPCPDRERVLAFGFYAYFEPVSSSADPEPGSPGFNEHRGYEADLLSALEAMDGVNLSLVRTGIGEWDSIWLKPSGPGYDMVGGGITALDRRTRDAAGTPAIAFTAGHIRFRQSLLVRAEDAKRIAGYDALDSMTTVGVFAATTGEARLLELTGLTDANGVLAAGVRVDTPAGTIEADGTPAHVIAANGASPALVDRRRLGPASADMPEVVYLADDTGLVAAVLSGEIDAVARGEIGNRHAAHLHAGSLVIGAVDDRSETGSFAIDIGDTGLMACLDTAIAWLTDNGRIGYADWLGDPTVFDQRARLWSRQKR